MLPCGPWRATNRYSRWNGTGRQNGAASSSSAAGPTASLPTSMPGGKTACNWRSAAASPCSAVWTPCWRKWTAALAAAATGYSMPWRPPPGPPGCCHLPTVMRRPPWTALCQSAWPPSPWHCWMTSPPLSTPCAGPACTPWATSWPCRRRHWAGAAARHSRRYYSRYWGSGRTCNRISAPPPPSVTSTGSATR